ncbi:hypothetical protein WR25_13613 [Diploscapter pachys]|uniref:Uncharacterized protein n=1 Tax=Diploscapter pachys TaxID=2018661 RepID=A0A2A2LSJ6_9BILA|nr:hypothetical protein WR25_13613 [Diploscapter pachys]
MPKNNANDKRKALKQSPTGNGTANKEPREFKDRDALLGESVDEHPTVRMVNDKKKPAKQSQDRAKDSQHKHGKDKPKLAENLPRRGFIRRTFGFLFSLVKFLFIASFGYATVQILFNCYEGGKNIPGSKPLCSDLTLLSQFKGPSANFWVNTRSTYGTVYANMDKKTRPYTQPAITWVDKQYTAFSKTEFGGKFNKTAYAVHSWVVEKMLLVQRFVAQKWKDLVSWYNKTGHKYFGSIVDNVRIAIRFVAEIAKDVFHYVAKAVSAFYHKVQDFASVWAEKGFSKAMQTIV